MFVSILLFAIGLLIIIFCCKIQQTGIKILNIVYTAHVEFPDPDLSLTLFAISSPYALILPTYSNTPYRFTNFDLRKLRGIHGKITCLVFLNH